MTEPEITQCSDNHFRRVVYSLAAYIADYPEQALLACIVQGWCSKYVLLKSNTCSWSCCDKMYCSPRWPWWWRRPSVSRSHRTTGQQAWIRSSLGGVWSCRGYCGMSFHNVIQSLNSHLINSLLPMTFLVPTSIVLFPWTFFISSSKAPSRITWSPGSRNTWYQFMVVQKQIGFLMILTSGLPKFIQHVSLQWHVPT